MNNQLKWKTKWQLVLSKEVTSVYKYYFYFNKEKFTLDYNRRKQKQKYLAENHISVFPKKLQNLYDHAKRSWVTILLVFWEM